MTARPRRPAVDRARALARLARTKARRAAGPGMAAAALLALGFAAGWLAGSFDWRRDAPSAAVEPAHQAAPPAAPRSRPWAGRPSTAHVALPPMAAPRGRIALVLDDLGLSVAATRRAIALDASITLAFLPYGERTAELAGEAARAGHDVLLHMPMEPQGSDNPGPDALLGTLAPDEIRARLDAALARVPGAVGLNNHMGSLFTADAEAMAVVIDEVRRRRLLILDSRTTADSVVVELASALGVPSGARDVFLDNDRDPAAIAGQLDELERLAAAAGVAVAIGHPYDETLAALAAWMPAARRRGFVFAPISTIARPSPAAAVLVEQAPAPAQP